MARITIYRLDYPDYYNNPYFYDYFDDKKKPKSFEKECKLIIKSLEDIWKLFQKLKNELFWLNILSATKRYYKYFVENKIKTHDDILNACEKIKNLCIKIQNTSPEKKLKTILDIICEIEFKIDRFRKFKNNLRALVLIGADSEKTREMMHNLNFLSL